MSRTGTRRLTALLSSLLLATGVLTLTAPDARADLATSPWTGTLSVSNTAAVGGFAPGSVQGTFTITPRQAAPSDGVYDALLTYGIDYTEVSGCLTFHYTGGGTNVPGLVTLDYGTLDPNGPPAVINFQPASSTSVQTFVTLTDCAGQVTGPDPSGGLVFTEAHVPPTDATGNTIQGPLPDFDATLLYDVTADLQRRDTNTAPVASDLCYANIRGTIAVPLAGFDEDGDPLTYSVLANPSHGTLGGEAPQLTYTPDKGYTGQDGFTYLVNDGTQDSNIATVTLWDRQQAPCPHGRKRFH